MPNRVARLVPLLLIASLFAAAAAGRAAPPCAAILPGGDFEAGLVSPWGLSGDAELLIGQAHGGARSVGLGGVNDATGELFVAVDLPANATEVALFFWWWLVSDDPNPGADCLRVLVSYGDARREHSAICNDAPRGQWQEAAVNLSDLAGQHVGITLQAQTDSTNRSAWFVDDVTLITCGPDLGRRVHLPLVGGGAPQPSPSVTAPSPSITPTSTAQPPTATRTPTVTPTATATNAPPT
ncbi:MAG: hypothetical protein V1772_14090, partial [Chloroflexota bacterium]